MRIRRRVAGGMTAEPGPDRTDADDTDRVVSRRVRNPTSAGPGDEAAYRAADPAPDGEPPADRAAEPAGAEHGDGATERAAEQLRDEDESRPTRSE